MLLYKKYFCLPDLFVVLLYEIPVLDMAATFGVLLYNNDIVHRRCSNEGSTFHRLPQPSCFY